MYALDLRRKPLLSWEIPSDKVPSALRERAEREYRALLIAVAVLAIGIAAALPISWVTEGSVFEDSWVFGVAMCFCVGAFGAAPFLFRRFCRPSRFEVRIVRRAVIVRYAPGMAITYFLRRASAVAIVTDPQGRGERSLAFLGGDGRHPEVPLPAEVTDMELREALAGTMVAALPLQYAAKMPRDDEQAEHECKDLSRWPDLGTAWVRHSRGGPRFSWKFLLIAAVPAAAAALAVYLMKMQGNPDIEILPAWCKAALLAVVFTLSWLYGAVVIVDLYIITGRMVPEVGVCREALHLGRGSLAWAWVRKIAVARRKMRVVYDLGGITAERRIALHPRFDVAGFISALEGIPKARHLAAGAGCGAWGVS